MAATTAKMTEGDSKQVEDERRAKKSQEMAKALVMRIMNRLLSTSVVRRPTCSASLEAETRRRRKTFAGR